MHTRSKPQYILNLLLADMYHFDQSIVIGLRLHFYISLFQEETHMLVDLEH